MRKQYNKFWLLTLFVVAVLNLPLSTMASAIREVSSRTASGVGTIPTVKVFPGSGVNISFIATGERIQKVWLDDPSFLSVDFDSALPGAFLIHLRRINYIHFEQIPSGNSTLLTVITEGRSGKKQYLFNITYGQGEPDYVALNIVPDKQEKQASVFLEQQIRQGLTVAQSRGLISQKNNNLNLISRVESFLEQLKAGNPLEEAAANSGISMALVNKLSSLGRSSLTSSPLPTPTSHLQPPISNPHSSNSHSSNSHLKIPTPPSSLLLYNSCLIFTFSLLLPSLPPSAFCLLPPALILPPALKKPPALCLLTSAFSNEKTLPPTPNLPLALASSLSQQSGSHGAGAFYFVRGSRHTRLEAVFVF